MKSLHICYISQEYPPETGWGGIGSYTYEIAHALNKAGHRVTVISLAVGGESVTDDAGVEVHRVSPGPNWSSLPGLWRLNRIWPGFAWAAMHRLRRIHSKCPIDIVEAAEGRADSFFISYLPGRPKLVTRLHTARIFVDRLNTVRRSELRRWEYWLEKKSILRANLLTAPSQAVVDLTRTWLPFSDEVLVVPNPVDENKFRPGAALPKKVVVYAGRLERRKGIDTIARAIPQILKEFPTVDFLFIGSDSVDSDGQKWSGKLLAAVDPAQRSRVRFEQKSREALIQAYQEATVCILPSVWENFPYALLEPMSCGTPVVATRCGGFPELIESGVSGFLVPVGDSQALASRISELLQAPKLRDDIGRNARKRVEERFSLAQVAPAMLAAYENAIARN
jgi:glycosyltransferase involved in cell wall biosynthesis